MLNSFEAPLTAVVLGASGGVGAAIANHLAACPQVGRVWSGSRSGTASPATAAARAFAFDLADEASLAAAAERCAEEGSLDLVVVATGVLHDGPELQPEKSWRALSAAALAKAYAINAIGPALAAKHFLPRLGAGRKTVFAALSARVGSIGDNRLGGWHAYRASKAGLNMLLRTCAIELARVNPDAACIGLHPGTVATPLSAPFARPQSTRTLFDPADAAERLLGVIDTVRPEQSGQVLAWDGQVIPP